MSSATIDPILDAELETLARQHERAHLPSGPVPSAEDKNYAVLTHIATLVAALASGGLADILVPAVAYVLFKDKSAFLKDHAKHQLNFQLTFLVVALAAVVLSIVTLGVGLLVAVPLVIGMLVVDVVCTIQAALAAHRGEDYKFPFAIEFLK